MCWLYLGVHYDIRFDLIDYLCKYETGHWPNKIQHMPQQVDLFYIYMPLPRVSETKLIVAKTMISNSKLHASHVHQRADYALHTSLELHTSLRPKTLLSINVRG